MKYLNLIIFLAIALCIALLWGYTKDLGTEVLELKARDRLLSEENRALRDYIGMVDDKTDRIKAEVQEAIMPYHRIIPIDGGYLAIRDVEEMNGTGRMQSLR